MSWVKAQMKGWGSNPQGTSATGGDVQAGIGVLQNKGLLPTAAPRAASVVGRPALPTPPPLVQGALAPTPQNAQERARIASQMIQLPQNINPNRQALQRAQAKKRTVR